MTEDVAETVSESTGERKGQWRLSPGWRRALLIAHLIAGIGWLGALLAVAALSVDAGPESTEAMHRVVTRLMVPPLALGFGASVSGVILALGSKWRLFRHWWVVVKLILVGVAFNGTMLLLQQPLADAVETGQAVQGLTLRAGGMAAVLGLIVVISVLKPWGRTRRRS